MYKLIGEEIPYVEVETEALKRSRSRHQGRFLRGPPLRQIGTAAHLPGQALALLLAVHHQIALTGKRTVTLPRSLMTELGINKDAKARGLRALEGAGLIVIEREAGRTVRAGLK